MFFNCKICVFVVQREENKTIDNWNYWFWGFLVQTWLFRDHQVVFRNWFAETQIVIVFWGARCLGQASKRFFWTKNYKTQIILTDN